MPALPTTTTPSMFLSAATSFNSTTASSAILPTRPRRVYNPPTTHLYVSKPSQSSRARARLIKTKASSNNEPPWRRADATGDVVSPTTNSDIKNTPDNDSPDFNVWKYKPVWCQPWSIMATGIGIVGTVYMVSSHSIFWTGGASTVIGLWWYLFLYEMPMMFREQMVEERRLQLLSQQQRDESR